jgi:hypothetical protein
LLSVIKNRIDVPAKYYHVGFDVLRDKSFPPGTSGPRTGKDLTAIKNDEGDPVWIEGYLLDWKEEGAEVCNCGEKIFDHVDYHLWLVENPGDPLSKAIVVELSPRMRKVHKGRWIDQAALESDLDFLSSKDIPVRIYGWILFDGEHVNQLTGHTQNVRRATLWEIHPVTKIESFQNGKWIEH